MNYTFTLPALDQMDTPILICNAKGVVIYKNPAAMRAIRLPRRNTSVRSHLRQAEEGELSRLPQRKKPSILTLHTGDRPARALVMPYVRDENSGPALAASGVDMGEVCSLWVFPAVLQVFSTSQPAQYIENIIEELAADICALVKQADCISGLLPGKDRRLQQQKLDRRLSRVLTMLENLPEGRWFDLHRALQILLPIATRRLEYVGAKLEYEEDGNLFAPGQAVDLPRMALLLLHLLTYCVALSGSRSATLRLCPMGEGVGMRASFTLSWPPFTVTDSDDLSRLCLLLPGSQLELLVLAGICKGAGTKLTYSLTEEPENNLTLALELPVMQRAMVRTLVLTPTEQLYLERDLEAIFGAVWEETLAVHPDEGE